MTDTQGREGGPLVPYAQVGRRDASGLPVYDFCPYCGGEGSVFVDDDCGDETNPPVTCDSCWHGWESASAWKAEISDIMHEVESARGLRP